jgi:mRNA interferase RelE/StbE
VTESEPEDPYELIVASSASRAISEYLPESVAWVALDFINGPLLENPRRVGGKLGAELEGLYAARLVDYRIEYEIDEEQRSVKVVRIARRADIYGLH